LLAGCGTATKVAQMTPEIEQKLIVDLKNGNAVLDCGMSCEGSWSDASNRMFESYSSGAWENLGLTVMQIGRRRDLGYFYLGAAAAGLGAHEAAVKYFRMSGALATDFQETFKCTGVNIKILLGDDCHGVVLPRDIYKPLWASEAILVAQRPKTALPSVATTTQNAASRPKKKHIASAAPQQPPATPAPPPSAASEGWITPPPVTR